MLTNRGLIVPADDGFRLRCNNAYNAGTGEDTRGFADGPSRIVVRGYAGVFASEDLGCSFTRAEALTSDPIGAFARTADGGRVLVSSLNYEAESVVMASDDAARSFVGVGNLPIASVVESLRIAPSNGRRVYAGGSRYDAVQAKLLFTWLVSDDGGASFRSQDVSAKRTPVGVHPSDREIVFAAELVDELVPETRLLRSVDGGLTFSTVLETTTVLSFVSTDDASRIWLGAGLGRADTKRGGLFVSRDQGATFAPALDQVNAATCLDLRGDRLWLCGNLKPNNGGIWYSDDQGETLEEYLTFDDVTSQVPCSEDARDPDGGVCAMLWADWVYEQTGAFPSDAGVEAGVVDAGEPGPGDAAAPDDDARTPLADAGGALDAETDPPTRRRPHDGCSASSEYSSNSASLLTFMLIAWALGRRRPRASLARGAAAR